MAQTSLDWLASFAAEAGINPPTPDEVDTLLELAGVAAHSSERTAAPLTCWLAARAGLDPATALAMGKRVADKSAASGS
jgi:hypothetical protein